MWILTLKVICIGHRCRGPPKKGKRQDFVALRAMFSNHTVWDNPVFQHPAYGAFMRKVGGLPCKTKRP